MYLKRTAFLTITLILLFLPFVNAIALDQKAPYNSFTEQLDNSCYQAVAVVKDKKSVDFNPYGYGKIRKVIKYTLEINEEFSLITGQNSIVAILEDSESQMEIGKKYFVLSELYYNYREIVFPLSCYYLIQNDNLLTIALPKNDYRKPAGNYTLDKTRGYISSTREPKTLSYVDVEKHLDFILSDCNSIRKGIMIGIYKNDEFTDKMIALSETIKQKTDNPNPSNYHYTNRIIYATAQNVKGNFLSEYISIPAFIDNKVFYLILTKDSPGWEDAKKLYDNLNANEFSKRTNVPIILQFVGLTLFIILTVFVIIHLIKRRQRKLREKLFR